MSIFALKQAVARGVGRGIDLDRLIARGAQRYVLAYHRVLPPGTVAAEYVQDSMWVSPETFESQIRWMQAIGDIVDYATILDPDAGSGRPMFAITFDDGWRDNYDHAFPILRKYDVPALIFLVTAAAESGLLFWPEELLIKTDRVVREGRGESVSRLLREYLSGTEEAGGAPLALADAFIESLKVLGERERGQRIIEYYRRLGADEEPLRGYLLGWDEIREMRHGGVRFGSHSHTHKIFKGLPEEQRERELRVSRQMLREQLSEDVDAFCYPNARYNADDGRVLARCGYRYAFRIDNFSLKHCSDPYYVPRFLVYEQIAANQDYFRMRLLEVPFYKAS